MGFEVGTQIKVLRMKMTFCQYTDYVRWFWLLLSCQQCLLKSPIFLLFLWFTSTLIRSPTNYPISECISSLQVCTT